MMEVSNLVTQAQKQAQLWEGILRMMEVNNRTTFEIGIKDVREIAILMRSRADGRK